MIIKDTHTVYTERDTVTGTVTREEWRKDGKLDRADGPAFIMRDTATGPVTHEEWCRDGKLDRADGPAVIERNAATGAVTREEWCRDGLSIDPPARSSAVISAARPHRLAN